MLPAPPLPTLFPYTTLFRSVSGARALRASDRQDFSRPVTLPFVSKSTLHPESCLSPRVGHRSEEHTSELQSLTNLVCRLLLEKKKKQLLKLILLTHHILQKI